MKRQIVAFLKRHKQIMILTSLIYSLPSTIRVSGRSSNEIHTKGSFLRKTKIQINGKGNRLNISNKSRLSNCLIFIQGNNCNIEINENCILSNLELWIEDNYGKIIIGSNTTIEGGHIASTEGVPIAIGTDCMFSNNIQIRSGDSHPIFDSNTKTRINKAKTVMIGNHVWLGADVKVLKGAEIRDNTIVGTSSLVTNKLSANSIYAGIPSRKIREGIYWERDRNAVRAK